jgi:very-short-patch-repair endonuclease
VLNGEGNPSSGEHAMSVTRSPGLVAVAKELCRSLRKNQTNAESLFWNAVRDRQIDGLKFYRQYPLFFDFDGKETFFIADFFCYEKGIAVEIDGEIHDAQRDHDEHRTHLINLLGVTVLRFRNQQVEEDMDGVLRELKDRIRSS